MYNYNRDVYQMEFERAERMASAASRRLPPELRSDNLRRAGSWLSQRVVRPAAATTGTLVARAGHIAAVFSRRATSRAAGLLVHALGEVGSLVPGRA